MKVYLHMKQFRRGIYASHAILVNIYADKKDAKNAATPKNPNGTSYDHFVVTKTVK